MAGCPQALAIWLTGALAAASPCLAAAVPAGWRDILGDRTVEVRAEGAQAEAATLGEAAAAGFSVEIEAQWTPTRREPNAGFELAVGPHAVGSGGYRLAVDRQPWRTVECRGPRLGERAWHVLRLTAGAAGVEYRVRGDLVAWVPGAIVVGGAARLRALPGTVARVRRCWLRTGGESAASGALRLVYAAEGFDGPGWPMADEAAASGRAVRVTGRGRQGWLLRGQDASLPSAGAYVAWFGVRGISGAATLWLEAAQSGGATLGSETLRLEDLPRDAYARVPVRFVAAQGRPLEYRVAASGGSLRIDAVTVMPARFGTSAPEPEKPVSRVRQAPRLAQAWTEDEPAPAVALSLSRLSRRLADGGWYEFEAAWRQDEAERLDSVALDLWVACRDEWGRVRVVDFARAYSGVHRGAHATSAWLAPEDVERLGSPVAAFAQVSWQGKPAARRWRKWGIPVEDKWILGAEVAGQLRPERPTE